MKVMLVDTEEGFAGLNEAWHTLVSQDPGSSLFQTFEWQSAWWRHYGRNGRLKILTAVDSAGEVVAILPLYRSSSRVLRFKQIRKLQLIGRGGDTAPDDLGLIARPEVSLQAARLFVSDLLAQSDWDVLELTDLKPENSLWNCANSCTIPFGHGRDLGEPVRILYTSLPASWEQYLASRDLKFRGNYRSRLRKFLAMPDARLYQCKDDATLHHVFAALVELHRRRWEEKGEEHAFSSPQYVAFHQEIARVFLQRGWLRMYSMQLGTEVIGVQYCYAYRRAVYHFQGGFNPDFSKFAPGICILGFAVQSSIEEGFDAFDMLRGEYDYKRYWADQSRSTYSVTLYRPTLGAAMHRVRHRAVPALRARLRQQAAR